TGDDFEGNAYEQHNNHEEVTPESALENLYTHDWDDDGEAVRGITDWMYSNSAPESIGVPERGREEALAGFMDLMEDSDFKDSMFGSGHDTVDDEGTEWFNVSISNLNPQLADSFGDIFLHYMDEFSETDGLEVRGGKEEGDKDGNDDEENVFGNEWNPDIERLELSPESRLAFTQLIMGDQDTAERIYGEVILNTGQTMEDYSTNTGEREHVPTVLAGSLQGLVDEALERESKEREINHNEESKYKNKVKDGAVDILGGIGSDAGVPGFVVEVAKYEAKESLEIEENEDGEHVQTLGEWAKNERMKGFAISALAHRDPDLMDEFVEHGITKEDENGDPYVPVDHVEWDVPTSAGVLATVFDEVSGNEWADGGSTAESAVFSFIGAFDDNRQKWSKVD